MPDIDPDEPLFSKLSDEDKEQLQIDQTKLEFTRTSYVSKAIQQECEAEMEFGRTHGWSIRRFKAEYKKV
jgi:hypothetical protein